MAIGGYFFLQVDHDQPGVSPAVPNKTGESSSVASNVSIKSATNTMSSSRKTNETSRTTFPHEEYEQLKDWLSSRGYESYKDRGDYESYSDEILSKLAKNGDLKAIGLLIPKFMERGDKESAIRLMNTAVVYGSTVHLDNLTIYAAPDYTNDKTEETRRPAALETLALTKVMALRGDKSLSEVSANSFLKSYKRKYNTDLTLSDEEKQIVDQRAQEIYDSFQEVRRAIGLGDFDNLTPAAVNKFFGSSK